MDVFSHGLWSAALYRILSLPPRKSKKIWWAFFWGVMPDIFSFGIVYLVTVVTRDGFMLPVFLDEHGPNEALVPRYVFILYSITHSLIIFLMIFFVVWVVFRRPFWEMGGWGLHILLDIPTHTSKLFPTPFLWPFSPLKINGTSWGTPEFIATNYFVLAMVYIAIYFLEKRASELYIRK